MKNSPMGSQKKSSTVLRRMTHLQVRSRTSSFAFKNNRRDLRDVATRLDVSFVLDGSIRRSGNHFQIDARLLQASTGVTLWNESFDRDVGDVFAIRNQITQKVVERLGVKSRGQPARIRSQSGSVRPLPAARALVSRRGPGVQKAIEYFQQVIAMAPEFAPAYAGIADAYAHMSLPTYQGMPVSKAQGLMRTAALKALELDPDLAEAHAAMGIVSARDLDWSSSQRAFPAGDRVESESQPGLHQLFVLHASTAAAGSTKRNDSSKSR